MTLDQAQARIAELEDHLSAVLKLCDHANKGAFANGVVADGVGDEGDVIAGHIIESARAALSSPPPVAVWPRVVQVIYGPVIVFRNANESGEMYDGSTMYRVTRRTSVESWLADFPADRELHGPEKAAMLARCGLDENGKAKAKDGV